MMGWLTPTTPKTSKKKHSVTRADTESKAWPCSSWHDQHGFCTGPRHIAGREKVLRDQILARAAMCSHVLQWLSPLQIYICHFYYFKTETRKLHLIENLGILYPHLHKNTCKTRQFSTVQPHENKLQTCTRIHIHTHTEVSFKVHEKQIK